MGTHYCPLCYEELVVKEVTPCADCGADEAKVRVLKIDISEKYIHDSISFNVYRAFEDIEVTLCDFCSVDIGSYYSEFFKLPKGKHMGYEYLQFVEHIYEPQLGKDKYCEGCGYRLAFLKFVMEVRSKFNA